MRLKDITDDIQVYEQILDIPSDIVFERLLFQICDKCWNAVDMDLWDQINEYIKEEVFFQVKNKTGFI